MSEEKRSDSYRAGLYTAETFDARLDAALKRQPMVSIPEHFSAGVAARAMREKIRDVEPGFSPRRPGWGGGATVGSLVLLLVLMVCVARLSPGPVPAAAECTLASEFLALLFGLLYLRRLIC